MTWGGSNGSRTNKIYAGVISSKKEAMQVRNMIDNLLKQLNIEQDFDILEIHYYDSSLSLTKSDGMYIVLFRVNDIDLEAITTYIVADDMKYIDEMKMILPAILSRLGIAWDPDVIKVVHVDKILKQLSNIFSFIKGRKYIIEEKVRRRVEVSSPMEDSEPQISEFVTVTRYGANILKFENYLELDAEDENKNYGEMYF